MIFYRIWDDSLPKYYQRMCTIYHHKKPKKEKAFYIRQVSFGFLTTIYGMSDFLTFKDVHTFWKGMKICWGVKKMNVSFKIPCLFPKHVIFKNGFTSKQIKMLDDAINDVKNGKEISKSAIRLLAEHAIG